MNFVEILYHVVTSLIFFFIGSGAWHQYSTHNDGPSEFVAYAGFGLGFLGIILLIINS